MSPHSASKGGRLQAQGAKARPGAPHSGQWPGWAGPGPERGRQLRQGAATSPRPARYRRAGQMQAMLLGGPRAAVRQWSGRPGLGLRQRKVVGRYLGPIAAGPAGQGRFSGKMGGKIRRTIGGHSPRIIDLGNHPSCLDSKTRCLLCTPCPRFLFVALLAVAGVGAVVVADLARTGPAGVGRIRPPATGPPPPSCKPSWSCTRRKGLPWPSHWRWACC